jgi:PAS domain S-box-containing protein
MPGDRAAEPVPAPEALPAVDALKRWQDFYADLADDVTRLAATKALIRALPETIPDALLITDAVGVIVLVNTQLELMFGYHRTELIGKTPELLLPMELRTQHADLRRDYSNAPRSRNLAMAANMKFRVRRKNGTEFRVHVMLSPVATPDGAWTVAVIRRVEANERGSGLAVEAE